MKIDILFVKFILVGILNTLFGYGVYALLLYLGVHYSICVIAAAILGTLFNFKTIGILVFNNSDNKLIFKFVAVYSAICLFNIGLLRIAELMKFNLYIAGFVITCISAMLSFIINKKWVFKS